MSNHFHLIWQMNAGLQPEEVQRDFLKYTAQKIKLDLKVKHPAVLEHFRVGAIDREYQFWQRKSLSIELRTHKVYLQKLDYIHDNPVKAGLCRLPEQYKYSSAQFYHTGNDNWGFLSHYCG
ncbi:MAG TPA: hypothetical protein VK644_03020 [Chitinophagaceae bacterium]|nr:hypothetical protein [Chitinophagaceae bacterium]